MALVDELVAYGADEIGLKDMAGVGRPALLGKLVKAIKEKYPHILVQYHGHSGPGFSVASMLEVAYAGADIIDVAMEPLAWGMSHPDVITIQAMLKDAGFDVPEINMNAYMQARSLTQEFVDDFLGYFIDPKNKQSTSLLVGCGLPGGMMGSMMADLKGAHAGVNMFLRNSGKKELTEDELMVQLFEEVEYVWPKVGTPPLVTPFSQYVKNIALMNIMQMAQGKPRYSQMDKNTWDMILGRTGKLPGTLAPEIIELAKEKNYEFFTGIPQDNYPNELDVYRKEMDENGWEYGPNDEELFELAMHDRQYRDYKTGVAKKKFEEELEAAKKKSNVQVIIKEIKAPEVVKEELIAKVEEKHPNAKQVVATATGIVIWELPITEQSMPKPLGTSYKEGDIVCWINAYFGNDEVKSLYTGKLCAVVAQQGDKVKKGDIIAFVE
jgi:pyruvate carboxylase subunit B